MQPDKLLQLLLQSIGELLGFDSEVQQLVSLCSIHSSKALLQTGEIVLQRQIKHRALMHPVIPKGKAIAHMIGKLCHKERFSHLGRTHKEIRSGIQQIVYDWSGSFISSVIKLRNGYRPQRRLRFAFRTILCYT